MDGRKLLQVQDAEHLVDESPMAFKPIDKVMEEQKDLVRVVHELREDFNHKGVERSKRPPTAPEFQPARSYRPRGLSVGARLRYHRPDT
jgi:hypothetical protein